jgi:D-alanyl-D-alanine carboxypeptidase (penicillin-binding protein 5/6)
LITLGVSGLLVATLVVITPAIARSTTTTTSSTTTTTSSTTTLATSTTTTTTTTTTTLPATIPARLKLPWPKQGSAAIAVPALSIAAASPSQPQQAIASLTKMMTTWVVLHHLPLTYSQRGPCLVVTANDVALYRFDIATDQSSAAIKIGETLCEGTLLRGMLVHSAGNYAQLLVNMLGMTQAQFVNEMNRDAKAFGMSHTRYVDYTGISAYDRSTAQDQTIIAVALMTDEPIVRSIVALSKVKLPVAGVVVSYTPFIGQDGVVGVKSGFTNLAGGCDVMAINYSLNDTVITTYAVDLGQHGGNALAIAGEANLLLSHSLRSEFDRVTGPTGVNVEWEGWPGYEVATTTTTTSTTTTSTSTTTSTTSTTTTVP